MILDRYSSSINSSNLLSKPTTTFSDSDVLGAMGLAGKHNPLAVALARLLAGDNKATADVVGVLANMIWRRDRSGPNRRDWPVALTIARASLAWYRHGSCKACDGHGYTPIPGVPALSEHECGECRGTGRIEFEAEFRPEHRELARWAAAQIEREQGNAGHAALRCLR